MLHSITSILICGLTVESICISRTCVIIRYLPFVTVKLLMHISDVPDNVVATFVVGESLTIDGAIINN